MIESVSDENVIKEPKMKIDLREKEKKCVFFCILWCGKGGGAAAHLLKKTVGKFRQNFYWFKWLSGLRKWYHKYTEFKALTLLYFIWKAQSLRNCENFLNFFFFIILIFVCFFDKKERDFQNLSNK